MRNEAPTRMRELLNSGELIIAPGVYDGYSVRLVESMGFSTAATSGAGIANSTLGEPDVGVLSLLENVERCRQLARSVSIPIMADADTGYGNAVTVYKAIGLFEDAGVAGVNIEDQEFPKRCGHRAGKELITAAEMAKKIEAAVAARQSDDFIINARTDAIDIEGVAGAIARAKIYAAAGADMVFPDAVREADDIARFVDEVPVPISINIGFGIRSRSTTPLIPLPTLRSMGVRRVSVPRMLPAAAIRGMATALELLSSVASLDETLDRPDLLASMDEITALMGYEHIDALEQRFLLESQLNEKYHSQSA